MVGVPGFRLWAYIIPPVVGGGENDETDHCPGG